MIPQRARCVDINIYSAPGAETASGGGYDDAETDEESQPPLCKFYYHYI